MPRIRVLPYRGGSRGATALSRGLGGMCLRLNGSRFRPRRDDVIINWGNTNNPDLVRQCTLNNVDLRDVTNKRSFFERMVRTGNENIIPRFWTARANIPEDAFPIVCRTVLAGHSGEGIVIADTRNDLVDAPLYVQYVKKEQEWRVHVGRRADGEGVVIAKQRKARSREVPDDQVNWQVRNHQNGFIYARNDGQEPPQAVIAAATQALLATNLDFGAVDVIYHSRTRVAHVLEINTAPGLEGETVNDYVRFFTADGE